MNKKEEIFYIDEQINQHRKTLIEILIEINNHLINCTGEAKKELYYSLKAEYNAVKEDIGALQTRKKQLMEK